MERERAKQKPKAAGGQHHPIDDDDEDDDDDKQQIDQAKVSALLKKFRKNL